MFGKGSKKSIQAKRKLGQINISFVIPIPRRVYSALDTEVGILLFSESS